MMDYLIRILALLLCANSLISQELDRVAVIVNDGVVLESDIQQRIADFKKISGLTRKLAIPFLEFLDNEELTERWVNER